MALVVLQILGFIAAAIILTVYFVKRPKLCNSCKHLKKKYGGAWKYTCNKDNGKGGWSSVDDHFDKAPTFCEYYKPREN